ncbi:hypothetical protein MMC30_007105 [Trapelia coarctata]|nr:hypothetical protein [Trapelia coarctata]
MASQPEHARLLFCDNCRTDPFGLDFHLQWLALEEEGRSKAYHFYRNVHGREECVWCEFLLIEIQKRITKATADAELPEVFTIQISLLRVHGNVLPNATRVTFEVNAYAGAEAEIDETPPKSRRIGEPLAETTLTASADITNTRGISIIKDLTREIDGEISVGIAADGTMNLPDIKRQCRAALSWINDCQHEHELCPHQDDPLLPHRLLDVSADGGESLKLYVSQEGERGRYAALSYCWGGPQRVMTTMDTIEAHIDQISENKLPQTLADAIKVTRGLGLRYLWIDSFCIIQDSPEDKEVQLASMGNIYHNAYITIVAAKASSVEDGFLKRFPAMSYSREPVGSNPGGSEKTTYDTSNFIPNWDPLFERAWSLDISGTAALPASHAECDLDLENPFDTHEERLPAQAFLDQTLRNEGPMDAREAYISWIRCVNNYSRCTLSLDTDKFHAIAGLAERYADKFNQQLGSYVAGNWGTFMIDDLRWMGQPARKFSRRPPSRAPTWSWAAIDGAVLRDPPQDNDKLLSQAIAFGLSMKSKKLRYGEVSNGALIVKGPLVAVDMALERSERLGVSMGYDLHVQERDASAAAETKTACVGVGILDAGVWPDSGFQCLGLAMQEGPDEDVSKLDGMLLLPIEDRDNEFVRCEWYFGFDNFLECAKIQQVIIN